MTDETRASEAARPARGLRIACASMAALLAFAALVQSNDPDPGLWILAYAMGAGISFAGAAARFWPRPTLAFALVIQYSRFTKAGVFMGPW